MWRDLKDKDVAEMNPELGKDTKGWWCRVVSYGFVHRSPRDDKLCNLFLDWIYIAIKACLASHPPHRLHLTNPWPHSTDTHVGTSPSREGKTWIDVFPLCEA